MYIVAIAWAYVALTMAITEPSIVAGVLTVLCYGLLPCALFLWLVGTPQRRRNRQRVSMQQFAGDPDRRHPQRDE